MTTLTAHIRNILPSRLWLLKLAAKLAGATIKVWRSRPRREKEEG
jgi:hypothetical protein